MIAPTTLQLALLSAAVLGFRHGFDYDHIAAISDITSIETSSPRRAMQLGLLYALGHAAVVAMLGIAVILFRLSLPVALDRWAERAVGLTLVLLGIYVLGTLVRSDLDASPKSRLTLMLRAAQWTGWKLRKSLGIAAAQKPRLVSWNYGRKSVFFVGMVHGLGAETPTQLLLFLLAANLGGMGRGLLGLAMFLGGLLAMNTLVTASAVGLFGASVTRPLLLRAVTASTAVYSLVVGVIFLLGSPAILPALGS
jgi:high-affinity nickel permease